MNPPFIAFRWSPLPTTTTCFLAQGDEGKTVLNLGFPSGQILEGPGGRT